MLQESQNAAELHFEPGLDVLVHYYPGMISSGTQATRYIPCGDKVTLPTGETAMTSWPGIPLFEGHRFYFPPMEEVDTFQGATFFAKALHWIQTLPSLISHHLFGIKVIRESTTELNEHSYNGFAVKVWESSLGQDTDIREFAKSHQAIKQTAALVGKPRVYFGVSRGAAATFSAIAATPELHDTIKLCILEAPPSTLSGLFKFLGSTYFNSREFGKWMYYQFATLFLGKNHKTDKKHQARGHVDQFPNHIPLLIVSSKGDRLVPHESTIRLAMRVAVKRQRALDSGAEHVAPIYFLQLDAPNHNHYVFSSQNDSIRYRNTVHAICKAHQLPYVQEYAEAGALDMRSASLLHTSYKELLVLQSKFWETRVANHRHHYRELATNHLAALKINEELRRDVALERVEEVIHHAPLFAKKIVPRPVGLAGSQEEDCLSMDSAVSFF
jgi:hypothetical protein